MLRSCDIAPFHVASRGTLAGNSIVPAAGCPINGTPSLRLVLVDRSRGLGAVVPRSFVEWTLKLDCEDGKVASLIEKLVSFERNQDPSKDGASTAKREEEDTIKSPIVGP